MKKKIFTFLLIGLAFMCLTGCGTEKKEKSKTVEAEEEEEYEGVNGQAIDTKIKATIVNNDGKTEEKAWYELEELLEENNEYFRKHYDGAKVKITDKVESIAKDTYEHEIDAYVYEIVLSSGWYVYIDQNQNDLSDVLKGTKVEIESYIHDNEYWPIMHGTYTLPPGEESGFGKSQETVKSTIKVVS